MRFNAMAKRMFRISSFTAVTANGVELRLPVCDMIFFLMHFFPFSSWQPVITRDAPDNNTIIWRAES
jgi:hypothetical protein